MLNTSNHNKENMVKQIVFAVNSKKNSASSLIYRLSKLYHSASLLPCSFAEGSLTAAIIIGKSFDLIGCLAHDRQISMVRCPLVIFSCFAHECTVFVLI